MSALTGILNVRRAGARADGSDDAPAFNEAAARLGARGGGKLYCPTGRYHWGSPVVIDTDSVQLVGDGWADLNAVDSDNNNAAAANGTGTTFVALPGFVDDGAVGPEPAMLKLVSKKSVGRPVLGTQMSNFRITGAPAGVHGMYLRTARGAYSNIMSDNHGLSGIITEGARDGVDGATVKWDTYDTIFENVQSAFNGRHGIEAAPTGSADMHFQKCILFANGVDGYSMQGSSSQMLGCHLYDNNRYNVHLRGVRNIITGNKIEGAGEHGLVAEAVSSIPAFSGEVVISTNGFKGNGMSQDNTFDHCLITGDANDGGFVIGNNRFSVRESVPRFGLHFLGGTPNQGIVGVNLFLPGDGEWGTAPVGVGGSSASGFKILYGDNQGFRTRNNGLATMAAGVSQLVVTHQMDVVPSEGEILLSFNSNPRGISQMYADQFTATEFRINCFPAPTEDVAVAWHIDSLGPQGGAGS